MVKARLREIAHDRVWWICLAIILLWMFFLGNHMLDQWIYTYNDYADSYWGEFLRENNLQNRRDLSGEEILEQ